VLEVPVRVANSPTSTVHVGRDSLRMVRDVMRVRRWSRMGAYAAHRPEVRQAAA